MKKILITGVNSYIGKSFEKWTLQYPDKYSVDTISMRDDLWKEKVFSNYDIIFHVAGLAHADVGKVSEERRASYYKVNRDLTIETAKKAKLEGLKQFIFMSSIIVYGDSSSVSKRRVINKDTIPTPTNFYGNSKLQAEDGIRALSNDNFKVVILRPPMIYGKGSKGNYPVLAKIARKLPLFPNVKNERSMLHIDNLCEFIRLMIDYEECGTFFPQNTEYVKTADMVGMIAKAHGKNIWISGVYIWAVKLVGYMPGKIGGLVNKAFGNLVYDKSLSNYDKGNYRIRSLEESINQTEG
ncbi:NAD-dependent epimerase/dehydratase family protein [Paenibacillus sp. LMG 31460]|uniref:NAD-dependent epimerase/dehydratase family protein n=1 Tax=Paenibacillus germinis TaxID=2654979 RepID=A0ABX1Z6W4_9BACL|nr:NAD-dependent epimerase/dehydratase family protein [Paenibacillus germinis]NOU88998.1 NAD-dependent epimerase/dehydratase family protein [Paenibacillus germinis]